MQRYVRSQSLAETVSRWGCQPVERYQHDKQIGEGTYGKVYKGFSCADKRPIASKRIRTDFSKTSDPTERRNDGFPLTAIREIALLHLLRHTRIVNLIEVAVSHPERYFSGEGAVVIIFEYCDHDLAGLHNSPSAKVMFTPPAIKNIMYQLLQALAHCHDRRVLHRDIKMSNVLINANGDVKLCDFGLARRISKTITQSKRPMTPKVVTRWYRAPEVFLGDKGYSWPIDIWSVGCIFAELLTGEAPFRSATDSEAVNRIWDICGSPDFNDWPEASELPSYRSFGGAVRKESRFLQHFAKVGNDPSMEGALDLLQKMLQLNPRKRITASDALDHHYFTVQPSPSISMASIEESHEFEVRKLRKSGQSQYFAPMPSAKRTRV
ncbi:hypothetical protein P9112_008825 [Eukaryota sp. TZLM1-RC]